MAGRKKAKIPWDKVDKLLEAGCTGTEIAAYLGVHPNTLYLACKDTNKCDFSEYYQGKRAKGNTGLKTAQYKLAMQGDKSMLIWLGKQRLGQVDKKEVVKIEAEPDKMTLPDGSEIDI